MMEATPRPWFLTSDDLRGGTYWTISIAGCEPIDIHEDDNGEANATLIVRAVNAHDDLLLAAKEAALVISGILTAAHKTPADSPALMHLMAAIKKAESQP